MSTSNITYNPEGIKNRKALLYTSAVCSLFLIIAIFYTWQLPIKATPVVQDYIDINLGNESEGFGDVQPLVPGDPAPDEPSAQSNIPSNQDPSISSVVADETNDNDAVISKTAEPVKTPQSDNKTSVKNTSKNTTLPNNNPEVNKPKVPLYKGGTGTGGAGSDQDNGYRNQGYKPGGTGDAGSPTGKPDAYGSTPGGKSGISVFQGLSGRHPVSFPNMQDEFNENAKIYVSIKVNADGKVTSASVSKSTTTNPSLKNIAIQKAKLLKFPSSKNDIEEGTILFNFVIKN